MHLKDAEQSAGPSTRLFLEAETGLVAERGLDSPVAVRTGPEVLEPGPRAGNEHCCRTQTYVQLKQEYEHNTRSGEHKHEHKHKHKRNHEHNDCPHPHTTTNTTQHGHAYSVLRSHTS